MRDVTIRLRMNDSDFMRKAAAVEQRIRSTAKEAQQFNRRLMESSEGRQAVSDVGGTFAKTGAVILGATAVAVRSFANFDEAMSSVASTGDDARQNIDALRDAAIEAGATTKYSATESAMAIDELARANVSAEDILSGGLQGALDMAAAGTLDVAEAAQYAGIAMTQFGLSGAQIPHVADLLAAGAGKANGEVSDLGMALKQSGLVASQMGLSIEETTGGLAAFAQAGLLGSDAGTSFKSMLQRLQNPSDESARTMEQLGINAYDVQGNFVGLATVAGQLQGAFEGKTQAERDSALATIFGSDAIRAASVLYQEGATGIQGWIDNVNDSGYASETAATKMDNLKGDLEELGGALETAFIGTGSGVNTPLREMAQQVTGVVNAYNSLPDSVQGGVGAIAGSTGVVLLASGGALKLASSYAESRIAMQQLSQFAPNLASRLTGLTKVTALAVASFVALGAAAKIDQASEDVGTVNEYAAAVERLGGNSKGAAAAVDELFKQEAGWNPLNMRAGIDGLGDAFEEYGDSVARFNSKIMPGRQDIDAVRDSFKQFDSALAGMVSSGNAEAAAQGAAYFMETGREAGLETKELRDLLPQYDDALLATSSAQKQAGDSAGALATESQQVSEEMQRAKDAARETAQGFLSYGGNLDLAKASASDFTRSMRQDARVLEQFAANAIRAGKRGLDQGLIQVLAAKGPEGARIMRQFARGTDQAIDQANAAFRRGERGAESLGEVIDGLPDTHDIKLSVTGELTGIQKASALRNQLLKIPTSITTRVEVKSGSTRYATGGAVAGPGTGTSDSVPALLSNGEHVWTAREVENAGGHASVYRLRAMAAAGSLPRFAGGGAVRSSSYYETVDSQRATRLEIARMEQRIIQLNRDLREREKTKSGRRLKLRGKDRQVAQLELQEAKAELAAAKRANALQAALAKRGSSIAREGDRARAREDAAKDAREEAVRRREQVAEDRRRTAEQKAEDAKRANEQRLESISSARATFMGGADVSGLSSPASVERAIGRFIQDSATYTSLLAQLKSKGAAPWLLEQLQKFGPSRSTIKLAQKYLADTGALARVNAQVGQLGAIGQEYATLVNDPRWANPAAWAGATGVAGKSAQITILATDRSAMTAEIQRVVRHEVGSLVMGSGVAG